VKRVRFIVMWSTLAAIGLLAVLSIVGAFLGAASAKALFTSPPLVAFWFFLAAILVGCFLVDWRIIRSPGLVGLHLGALLVLAGSMWGSNLGHHVAARLFGIRRIPHGMMVIPVGGQTDQLLDVRTSAPIGRLPFTVGLKDFRIAYYPPGGPWQLWFERPVPPDAPDEDRWARVPWTVGEETAIGETVLRVRVLRYLPYARPTMDAEGKVVGAEPDASSAAPAMEAEVSLRGRAIRGWLAPAGGADHASMPIGALIPVEVAAHADLALYLAEPPRMPKDYFSDLVILEGGRPVAEKTIEVNHPLRWDGYDIYQADYDKAAGSYTVLTVRSDSGLRVVYAGFWLFVVGALVRCWGERAWAVLARRRRHDV